MNLKALIDNYIPAKHVLDKKRIMFETLLNLLMREDIEATTRVPIVDNLFGFVCDKAHLELVQTWLEKGAITRENGEEVFKLGTKHRYSIVRNVYEDPSYSLEMK